MMIGSIITKTEHKIRDKALMVRSEDNVLKVIRPLHGNLTTALQIALGNQIATLHANINTVVPLR